MTVTKNLRIIISIIITILKNVDYFFDSRAYQCATQDDLWQALTDQAHQDEVLDRDMTVKDIMYTWTLQTGFPLVTVIRNYDTNSAFVTQVSKKCIPYFH